MWPLETIYHKSKLFDEIERSQEVVVVLFTAYYGEIRHIGNKTKLFHVLRKNIFATYGCLLRANSELT